MWNSSSGGDLWISLAKVIGSLRDMAVGHLITVLNEVPMGLNACQVIRSHHLIRSSDHLILSWTYNMFTAWYRGVDRIWDTKHEVLWSMPEVYQKCHNKLERVGHNFWPTLYIVALWLYCILKPMQTNSSINTCDTWNEKWTQYRYVPCDILWPGYLCTRCNLWLRWVTHCSL